MSEGRQPYTIDDYAGDDYAAGATAAHDEAALTALFARHLPTEPLSPAVLDRLTLRVLGEVQHTLAPSQSDLHDPAPRRTLRQMMEGLRNWLGRLTPKQSLLLAGAGAVVAMLLFVGISRITPRPLTTTAAVSGGDVTVLSKSNSRFHIQRDGDQLRLRQGDQVLTGDGSMQLAHFPDHLTVIEPGAYVELSELDDANGGMQLALTVHDGLVHSTLGAPLRPNDRYTIRTPVVAVSAAGTEFTVEAVDEQETLVTTVAGHVSVTMDGQTVTVGPGQEVDAVAGRALEVQPAGSD